MKTNSISLSTEDLKLENSENLDGPKQVLAMILTQSMEFVQSRKIQQCPSEIENCQKLLDSLKHDDGVFCVYIQIRKVQNEAESAISLCLSLDDFRFDAAEDKSNSKVSITRDLSLTTLWNSIDAVQEGHRPSCVAFKGCDECYAKILQKFQEDAKLSYLQEFQANQSVEQDLRMQIEQLALEKKTLQYKVLLLEAEKNQEKEFRMAPLRIVPLPTN